MIVALLLAASAPATAADVPGGAPIRVAPLRSAVAPATRIGRRRAGWTCFPAGSIEWRDLAFEPEAAAEAVSRSLAAHGVPTSDEIDDGGTDAAASVLRGTIRAAEADACWPQHALGKLIGGRTKLKGKIVLTITWTVRRADAPTAAFETRSEVDASLGDANLAALLDTGLARAGGDAAAQLAATVSH